MMEEGEVEEEAWEPSMSAQWLMLRMELVGRPSLSEKSLNAAGNLSLRFILTGHKTISRYS